MIITQLSISLKCSTFKIHERHYFVILPVFAEMGFSELSNLLNEYHIFPINKHYSCHVNKLYTFKLKLLFKNAYEACDLFNCREITC